MKNKKVLVSRDVIFFETEFPYQGVSPLPSSPITSQSLPPIFPSSSNLIPIDYTQLSSNLSESSINPHPLTSIANIPTNDSNNLNSSAPTSSSLSPPITEPLDSSLSQTTLPPSTAPISLPQPQRSTWPTRTPTTLQGFHTETALPSRTAPSSSSSEVNPANPSGTPHSIAHVLSYDMLFPTHRDFTINITLEKEPTSFSQAILEPCWKEAMNTEIQTHQANKTWSLVTIPPDKKLIGYK